MSELPFQDLAPEVLAQLRRHNLLTPLVRAQTMEAALRSVEVPDGERSRLRAAYLNQHNIDTDEQLAAHLKRLGLDTEALDWQLELPARIKRYSRDQFQHKAEPRFLAQKDRLDRVVYSLLRVKDGCLARELFLRISGDEANFADLASRYSQGTEARTKGIVGPVPMNQAHPALSERLRTSRPGELLEPFRIETWWLIARLERFEPAQFDAETAQAMTEELFKEWLNAEVVCKLTGL